PHHADGDVGEVQHPERERSFRPRWTGRQVPRGGAGDRDDEGDAVDLVAESIDAVVETGRRRAQVVGDDAAARYERAEDVRLKCRLDLLPRIEQVPEHYDHEEELGVCEELAPRRARRDAPEEGQP